MTPDQPTNPMRDEDELFRLLVDNVQDYAIFVIDPVGRVESWNPGAERLLGFRDEEIIGQSIAVFFTPEDVEKGFPQREMEQAVKESWGSDDRWHVRKDGSRFWCGGTLTPLWDERRTLRGFAKVMRDRTEWKRAEEERAIRIREAERRQRLYDAALSNTPDLIYVFDLDHRFIYANAGLLKMWGKTWDEAIDKTCLELGYEPWHAAMHDQEIEQVVATKQPVKGEVPFTGTFGRRIYEYIFVPVMGENGEVKAVAGTTRDVTDRRQAEERVRHSERFHRAIAELSTDYAFDGAIGPDGAVRIERVSEGFAKFYGLTVDEMNAQGGWGSVIHPDDHPVVGKTIERLLAGQTDRGEVRGLSGDGSVKWQSYLTVPIRDADGGRTVGLYGAATDVTAQRQMTEQLRERAESLSAILTATVDNIYLLDRTGRYRYVSLGGARVLGLEPGQMTGKRWQELGLPADIMEPFDAQRERAIHTGEPQRQEVTFTDQTGRDHHYEYTIAPVLGAGGGCDGVVVVSRDDTERKRAEEALEQAVATLRSFYDTSPVMMGVVEVGGEDVLHLTDNAATGRFFGTAADSLAGRAASEMGVPPDHLREWVRHYRESERTGLPARFEYPHETPDGLRWVSATVYCIERLPGGRCRCSYVAEDVTDRRRADETIHSLLRIGETLNSTLDVDELLDLLVIEAIGLVGAESGVAGLGGPEGMVCRGYVQRGDRLPLDYCWPPMHGLPGWLLVHKVPYLTNDALTDTQIIHELCARFGVRSALSTPILNAQGEVLGFFEIHNKEGGFTPADREKLLAVSHAASIAIQNALAYRRIRQTEQSLRDADRRKDEFLATLAHELRNPLAPIRNSLQILKMPRVDAAMAQQTRDMMERQVHHLVRLVDDLLDVSRVMRGKIELRREPVQLATVVAHAVETAQPTVEGQGHALEVSVADEWLLLDADPVRLAQVVGNLLANSAKYTEPNGRIWLTARREGGEAVLSVRDNGIGIASDMLPHVFELFVQADHATTKAQGGLGIGLTLVRNLVALHGGTVEARSDGLGKGSEFVVRLPISVAAPRTSGDHEPGRSAQPVLPSGHRLLVVDDNQDAAVSLAMFLKLQGHEVRVAHSGMAAIEMMKTYVPDVVFLDIGMPGMDGYEVARRIRQQAGLDRVVLAALTGWGQQEDRRRTKEAGFDHHLVKPPEPIALESVLATLKRPQV